MACGTSTSQATSKTEDQKEDDLARRWWPRWPRSAKGRGRGKSDAGGAAGASGSMSAGSELVGAGGSPAVLMHGDAAISSDGSGFSDSAPNSSSSSSDSSSSSNKDEQGEDSSDSSIDDAWKEASNGDVEPGKEDGEACDVVEDLEFFEDLKADGGNAPLNGSSCGGELAVAPQPPRHKV